MVKQPKPERDLPRTAKKKAFAAGQQASKAAARKGFSPEEIRAAEKSGRRKVRRSFGSRKAGTRRWTKGLTAIAERSSRNG